MEWSLHSQTIEVRFTNGFKFLDCAGEIAAILAEEHAGLRLSTANPGGVQLVDDLLGVTIDFSHERACITATAFQGSVETKKFTETFFPRFFEKVGIRNLSRVGNLNAYILLFPNRDKADQHIRKIAGQFGIKPSIFNPEGDERLERKALKTFTLRYDDATTAISLNFFTEEEKVKITGPFARQLRKHAPPVSDRVRLNVDMFTTAPLAVENFLAEALLDSNDKMVKTRILPFLIRL